MLCNNITRTNQQGKNKNYNTYLYCQDIYVGQAGRSFDIWNIYKKILHFYEDSMTIITVGVFLMASVPNGFIVLDEKVSAAADTKKNLFMNFANTKQLA